MFLANYLKLPFEFKGLGLFPILTESVKNPDFQGFSSLGYKGLNCLQSTIDGTQETQASILGKACLWERYAKTSLNERQIKMLNKLLDGFEGKFTSSKRAKIAKCSQDTAYRNILKLIQLGALKKDEAGGEA